MCIDDYDSPDFYLDKKVKAIKYHVCSECHKIINKGEIYSHVTGKWGDRISTFKTCQFCLEVRKWLLMECGGFNHGGLLEDIEEHAFEYHSMKLWRMVAGMRNRWKYKKEI